MHRQILPIAIFFGCLVVLLLVSAAFSQESRNTIWLVQHSQIFTTTLSWLPCIVLGVLGLFVVSKIIDVFGTPISSSATEIPEPLRNVNDSGDRLDPDTVRIVDAHSFVVSTLHGRMFVVVKNRRGQAAFQEIDRKGHKIGKTVIADPKDIEKGLNPNKQLAKFMKQKVEKRYEKHYNDDSETYDDYSQW